MYWSYTKSCLCSFQNTDTFKTGFSDFHIPTFTVVKQNFSKQKPKSVIHRQYKNFRNDYFRTGLENALLKYDFSKKDYDNFTKIFLTLVEEHAPLKKNYLRSNHADFMTKQLKKARLRESKFRNRSDASQSPYRKQCNLCASLLWKAKKEKTVFLHFR